MPQNNFLKKHIKNLVAELGKIQETICNTENIPVSELVKLQKKYIETQEALKLIGWLDEQVNKPEEVKKEKVETGPNGKPIKSKIITI